MDMADGVEPSDVLDDDDDIARDAVPLSGEDALAAATTAAAASPTGVTMSAAREALCGAVADATDDGRCDSIVVFLIRVRARYLN